MQSWSAILAGMIAASVALLGFAFNQQLNRRDRKTKLYAEALRAVREIEELPYRILRRAASDGATRESLGKAISDSFVSVSFYRSWLQIDSRQVGEAYLLLSKKSITHGEAQRSEAWATSLITEDAQANLPEKYRHASDDEWSLCMLAMKRELSPWSFLKRRSTQRAVDAHKARMLDGGGMPDL